MTFDYSKVSPNDSRPMDVYKWSEFPEAKNASKKVYFEVMALGGKFAEGHKKIINREIRVLIVDLFVAWMQGVWIGYSRKNESFYGPRRFKKIFISKSINKRVDALHHLGYIDYLKGQPAFGKYTTGVNSKIRATQKLIDIYEGRDPVSNIINTDMVFKEEYCYTIDYETIQDEKFIPQPMVNLIRLKDDNKEHISYEQFIEFAKGIIPDKTLRNILLNFQAFEQEIKVYNELARGTFIDFLKYGYEYTGKKNRTLYMYNKESYRVFNNCIGENYKRFGGSRLYGTWWANAPSTLRDRIFIDDKQVSELDYSSMHLRLCFWLKGTDYSMHFKGDPYSLDGYLDYRPLFKLIVLVCFNANSENDGINAVLGEIAADPVKFHNLTSLKYNDVKFYLDKFISKYSIIGEYFFSGIGTYLQYVDTTIIMKTLLHFAAKDVFCLSLHDSILIRTDMAAELEKVMQESWESTFRSLVPDESITTQVDIDHTKPFNFKQDLDKPDFKEDLKNFNKRYNDFKKSRKQNNFITIKKTGIINNHNSTSNQPIFIHS
jgi:hypothetical protein